MDLGASRLGMSVHRWARRSRAVAAPDTRISFPRNVTNAGTAAPDDPVELASGKATDCTRETLRDPTGSQLFGSIPVLDPCDRVYGRRERR